MRITGSTRRIRFILFFNHFGKQTTKNKHASNKQPSITCIIHCSYSDSSNDGTTKNKIIHFINQIKNRTMITTDQKNGALGSGSPIILRSSSSIILNSGSRLDHRHLTGLFSCFLSCNTSLRSLQFLDTGFQSGNLSLALLFTHGSR